MPPSTLPSFALLLACASCASDAKLSAKFTSGFAPDRHVISVLGVYKDGQMNAEAWDSLAPRVSASIGATKCEGGYTTPALAKESGPLWTAVDDYTRSNGPTDDLLAELAPAAQGDLVLVLTVAGKVTEEVQVKVQNENPQRQQAIAGTRGGLGGMRNQGTMFRGRGGPAGSEDALDIAALLYSVSEKKTVGQVSIVYTGHSFDEALAKFTSRLREALPGASCAGWKSDGKVDVERIRNLAQ